MEYKAVVECSLSNIPKEENTRIRTVGMVYEVQDGGVFVITDGTGVKVTCVPSADFGGDVRKGDFITVFGMVLPVDEKDVEVRAEGIGTITEKEYMGFTKYLNLKNELLNDGSGVK